MKFAQLSVVLPWHLHLRRSQVIRQVPIRLISVPPPWSPARLEDNLAKMKETKSVPPIELSWDKAAGKFNIYDGIHRTNVAIQLGYESIPAVLYKKDAHRLEGVTND